MTAETPIDLDAVRDGLEAAVSAAADAINEVLRQNVVRVGHKPGEGPVTEADHAADDVLHDRLMPLIDGAHWLSEESRQEAPLILGEPTWVVDPLDGTREFLRGLPEFGVSVGLFVDDRLVLGALAMPVQGEVMSGLIDGERREARRAGEPLPPLPQGGAVETVVVSRFDYEHRQLQHQIPYAVYPCGSAAVKLAYAADGEADVYFSTGPRSVWDVAGGAAVLEAAGGEVITFDGQPLVLSPLQIRVPPYVAGARESCLTLLRTLGAEL
ncbi:MAG TPA: inositol monophosphatase family protein [Dehalococcoidia bacterium]|nr:inositol monophosphatase family protein [Dehalococcoidia bacterium]